MSDNASKRSILQATKDVKDWFGKIGITPAAKQSLSFLEVVCLILITLKLAGVGVVAGWSWWLVLAPVWIPAISVLLSIAVIVCFFYLLTKEEAEEIKNVK